MKPWRPTAFLAASAGLHLAALLLLVLHFEAWRWALTIVLLDQAAIAVAGLWPRSTLLGPNLVRLPTASALRGEVAITIDDGPDPEVTPQVLAILAASGARASFFCIGERAASHPELCRAIVAGGHAVENHGQSHRKRYSVLGPSQWSSEVGGGQSTLTAITGRRPGFFRALAGLRNPFLDPVLHRLGLRLATWTRRGYDTRSSDPDAVLARLTHGLAAGDILLLHDGHAARTASGRPVILEVLPRLLDELGARGFKTVTLSGACSPA
ncbi:MAG TPA: polysaccharide deacetylase family protein [Burkholderiaceae bacterium]